MFAASNYPITIAQLQPFTKAAAELWGLGEIEELKDFLALNPQAGDVIPGTSGVRKLRWAARGRGKRGGARIIYYFRDLNMPLYLIAVYTKSQKSTLAQSEKRAIRSLVAELVEEHSKSWLRVVREQSA